MAQIKLVRKALVVAQGVAVHHANACLPEEVSGLLLGLFLQQRRHGSCACARDPNEGENSGWRFSGVVSRSSRDLGDGIIPSVDFATIYLALRFQLNN